MRRRMFTAASVVSLLTCAATVVLWVQGYRQPTEFAWPGTRASDGYHLNLLGVSWDGQVAIARLYEAYVYGGQLKLLKGSRGVTLDTIYDWGGILRHVSAVEGFAAAIPPSPGTAGEFVVAAPCWFLTLVFALMPCVWAVLGLRRKRRVESGDCAACGYDLRASSDRCPECGSPIPVEIKA